MSDDPRVDIPGLAELREKYRSRDESHEGTAIIGDSPFCSYDLERDILTFDGIRFTGAFMRAFVDPPPGDRLFRVERRDKARLVHVVYVDVIQDATSRTDALAI